MSKHSKIFIGIAVVIVVTALGYLKSTNIELGFFNSSATGGTWSCDTANEYFCPEAPMTRAEVAHVLVQVLKLASPLQIPVFSDVAQDNPYRDDINTVTASGIMPACTEAMDQFCPDLLVHRAEAAVVLGRAFQLSSLGNQQEFDDVGPDHPAYSYINALGQNNGSSGCGVRKFCPLGLLTRAQMAQWIGRLGDVAKPYDGQYRDLPLIYPGVQWIFGVSQIIAPMPFTNTLYDTNLFFQIPSTFVLSSRQTGISVHDARLLVFVDEIDEANGTARLTIGKQGGCSGEYSRQCAQDSAIFNQQIVHAGESVTVLGTTFTVTSIINNAVTITAN